MRPVEPVPIIRCDCPGILPDSLTIEIGIDRDEVAPLARNNGCGINGRGWTGRLARAAVDALAGIDEEMIDILILLFMRGGMDTIDGANLDARRILGTDTRLGDYISHNGQNLLSIFYR